MCDRYPWSDQEEWREEPQSTPKLALKARLASKEDAHNLLVVAE